MKFEFPQVFSELFYGIRDSLSKQLFLKLEAIKLGEKKYS